MTFQVPQTIRFSFYETIGKNYENGWWTNCHARYRLYKGARNTKKSYDVIGLEVLNKILTTTEIY